MDNPSGELNWPAIIIIGLVIIVLLVLMNKRNRKDKKDMEETMNQVDPKKPGHESDDESKI